VRQHDAALLLRDMSRNSKAATCRRIPKERFFFPWSTCLGSGSKRRLVGQKFNLGKPLTTKVMEIRAMKWQDYLE
jgi:hypothetical protein